MQGDNNDTMVPPSKLISKMEDLYHKYQNINDSNEKNKIKERSNEILIQVVKGLEEDEYEGWEIRPRLELHKKICIVDS